jgi:hypothetical protein
VLTCLQAYALSESVDDILPPGAAPAAHPHGPFSALEEARKSAIECQICFDAVATCTLHPCSHKICPKCGGQLQRCPLCREPVSRRTIEHEAPLSSSDIDVFLWGLSASEATVKLRQVRACMCAFGVCFKYPQHSHHIADPCSARRGQWRLRTHRAHLECYYLRYGPSATARAGYFAPLPQPCGNPTRLRCRQLSGKFTRIWSFHFLGLLRFKHNATTA